MKKFCFLLVLMLWCNAILSQVVVFDPAEEKSGSDEKDKQIITNYYRDIDDEITISMNWTPGSFNNDPALNSDNNVYKFYSGGKLTVNAKKRKILGIVLVSCTDKKYFFTTNKVSVDIGNLSFSSSLSEVIWTGNSNTVCLTNNSSVVWLSEIRVIVDAFYISESKCSTLYLPNSFKMPENVTGYTMIVDKGELKRKNVYKTGDMVPKETPLLIEGVPGTYVYEVLSNNLSAPFYKDNNLMGSEGKELKDGTGSFYYYKLSYKSNDERILGFYWGAEDGKSITVPAGKCCLKVSYANAFPEGTSSAAKGFSLGNVINSREEVMIATPNCYNENIYNINGIYVGDDRQKLSKGIYIQNGKKVVIE